MNKISSLLPVLFALTGLFLLAGCSGGSSPSAPQLQNPGLSDRIGDSTDAGRVLWGYFSVTLDPVSGEVLITPLRGLEFTCNVTLFLQPPISPINLVGLNLIIGECDLPNGLVACDVTLRHPFPGLPVYRGFDVRGVVMGDGSEALDHDPAAIHGISGDLTLLNADGYCRWWNPSEFGPKGTIFGYIQGVAAPNNYTPTATLNGYRYFADELGPESELVLDPSNRGTFANSPEINSRRYRIQFPMVGGVPFFKFAYAVDASWAKPDASGAPDYPLSSFPAEANCAEAYMIKVTDTGSTAWYVDDTNKGGTIKLDIEIFDWQAQYNLSGVLGGLSGLWLEGEPLAVPEQLIGTAIVSPGGPTSSVFQVEIDNLALHNSGSNEIWVIAESADPSTYEPQIDGNTSNFTWCDSPLAAYLRTSVDVAATPGDSPIVIAIDPTMGKVDTVVNATVTGDKFLNGCQVELRESGSPLPFVVQGQSEIWVSQNEVDCDLDLTGAPLGLYDVVVINPGGLEGSLEAGFEVVPAVGLVWHPEGVIDHPNRIPYNDIEPALVMNASGEMLCGFVWWYKDASDHWANCPRFAISSDGGLTFGPGTGSGWTYHGAGEGVDPLICWNNKYALGSNGYPFQHYNAPCGHTVGANPAWEPYAESISHSGTPVKHAGEMLYTSEGYPMLFGDKNGTIAMQRGDYPNQGGTGTSPVFEGVPHTLVNGSANWLSLVRSAGKTSDGISHLMFWNSDSLDYIQMISTSDISGTSWGTPVVAFNGLAEIWDGAMDPSLWIDDEDGFHTCFRAVDWTGAHHLMYGYSKDGKDWSEGSFTQIETFPSGSSLNDTGVGIFEAFGMSYVFVCYEVEGVVWCRYKEITADSFSDPIQVSEHSQASLPDLYPNGANGICFAYQADDGTGQNLTDVFYRMAEFVE